MIFFFVLGQLLLGNDLKTAYGSPSLLIEPTNTPLPESIYTFSPVADASLRAGSPDNNYGSNTSLETDNSPIKNFLIKFNVAGIGGRQVLKATLRIYNIDPSSKGGDFYSSADTSWSEGTVTWNNAPAADPAIIASLGAVAANNWYEIDLTSLAQADGGVGLRVTSTSSDGADYASREGINPPQLIVIVSSNAMPTPTLTPIDSPTPPLSPTPTGTPTITMAPTQTFTPAPFATPLPNGYVRFAVIGDFGSGDQRAQDVATLVKSWIPDFIVTTGDNNYPDGDASTIDKNIGKFYHDFISPYNGSFGAGASYNRFFPALGNHDWNTGYVQAYLDYFTLPNNERYYDFVQGPMHFFVLDSDPREPDGTTSTSTQAIWLQNQLAASISTWNIVVLHHSPFSSGLNHGSNVSLQWPYGDWGADVVLSAHDHVYERLLKNGLTYIVNGLGGASLYTFNTPVVGSQVRYNDDYGALLAEANMDQITFKFYSRSSLLVDTYAIDTSVTPTGTSTPTITPDSALQTATPTFSPTATNTPPPSETPTPTSTSSMTNTPLPADTPTATITTTNTSLPSSTPTPTATFSPTTTTTNTPTPTPTLTNTLAPSTSTGFLSPSANRAITSSAGDNNGYQTSPANAYTNNTTVATDLNSGTSTSTSCTSSSKDKHLFYNYNFNLTPSAVVKGIEVRLDARADSTSGSPKICVQISWDGGITWTTVKSTTTLRTTEATYIQGGPSDTWGHTWTSGNFSNANFLVRVIDVASSTSRDFYLEYIAVNLTYQP